MLKIAIIQDDICKVSADEQKELYEFAENDVFQLKPLPQGKAKVIEGNETWKHLVVCGAFYHNVNDVVFTPQQACNLLTTSIANAVYEFVKKGLSSIAMTLIGTTYRVTARDSILALSKGLASVRREDLEVKWCILREEDRHFAENICRSI